MDLSSAATGVAPGHGKFRGHEQLFDSHMFFDSQLDAALNPDSELEELREKQQRKVPLLCTVCRHPVTHGDRACRIHGEHERHCANPAGVYFHILCFDDASGCRVEGQATTDFSWFAGYAWQYALCAQCQTHLGWFFSGTEPAFFGLIKNRLTASH